ncbi:MAG: type II toxin-antitoxin system VapC family toxin [Gemmatimonadaceae bacterium]|nr:type II toxin-antitoxin system VapC family toxin [Gemmatimonadaceae bacterium]
MIVADANLIAYLILPGERTEQAEAVLLKDPVWVVPVVWASELRSVVSHYVRSRSLTVAQGSAAMERAAALIGGREAPVDSREVLELAHRSGCSSYDCEYVALAVSLDVALVTSDKAVLRAFPRVAVAPDDFLDEPTT